MLYHARNKKVNLAGTDMDYIRFGSGRTPLVMLPGLGDGLQTLKGTAVPMALMYRQFSRDFTVYMFSRKNSIPRGYTTRDMARDQAAAMEQLGIRKAAVLGVSMGGMIAQHLAVDYPETVEKLILVATSSRSNPILTESVQTWMAQAKRGDHTALMDSNVRKIYSDAYYRKNKWLVPIMGKVTKPESYDRFLIQAEACLNHNAFDELPGIRSATLVIGGEQDHCLGGDASREIAAQIPGAELYMYEQWGHGLYEEARDFHQRVLRFLT
ncbi:MAG: alpha/beta hydrolase [Oscillospiraceae bacterium]|nr:alpha/beta hydrolase [Oscillospiraceae bacterium]